MKVSKKEVLILLALLGILAGGCTYSLIFVPMGEKTQALVADNDRLRSQISGLQKKVANQDMYKSETSRLEKRTADIYQVFPVDAREEDCIIMAINQELISPMTLSSISINPVNDVAFEAAAPDVPAAESGEEDLLDEGADAGGAASAGQAAVTPGMLRSRQTTYSYTVSYEGLKRSIKHIADQTNRMAIDSLSASFDESTGLLSGSTTLNLYIAPNQEGKEYVKPDLSAVLLGTDNIFGTVEVKKEAGMPGVEDMIEDAKNAAEPNN